MESDKMLGQLERAVLEGDDARAADLARDLLAAGETPLAIVDKGLLPGIRRAGVLWEEGEYFLPELVTAAQALKAAMAIVQPALAAGGAGREAGRVVIGTVEGDIHDIGKTLVATLLAANGFMVSDEGSGVTTDRFVARARELDADLVCASALLTTTMTRQADLVSAVRSAGLRARVMVGGAPVTPEWAARIAADGHADNAVAAVALAQKLVSTKAGKRAGKPAPKPAKAAGKPAGGTARKTASKPAPKAARKPTRAPARKTAGGSAAHGKGKAAARSTRRKPAAK